MKKVINFAKEFSPSIVALVLPALGFRADPSESDRSDTDERSPGADYELAGSSPDPLHRIRMGVLLPYRNCSHLRHRCGIQVSHRGW